MGISMNVMVATDEQIRCFGEDASRTGELLNSFFERDKGCLLYDYWDGIHFMLTDETRDPSFGGLDEMRWAGAAASSHLPLAALKKGDVMFPDYTHAIYSTTVKTFEIALQQLTESELRERYNKLYKVYKYPTKPDIRLGRSWEGFVEIMFYYGRLRNRVAKAATQGNGMVFYRYEDW